MSQNYVIGPLGPGSGQGLNGAALYRPRHKHPALTVFNTGSTTVFLNDEDPIRDPSAGLPLTAGSSIPWDADRALFATCPTSGTLTVTTNSGIPFDAGAVAAQILSQGLAAQIAANIAISGAPPIDAFASIGTPSQAVSNASASPILDMRKYQSLFISILKGTFVGCLVTIDWFNDAAASVFIEEDAFYVAKGFITQYSQLAKGPFAQISFTATSGTGTLNAFGSYKALQNSFYNAAGGGPITGGIEHGTATASFQEWEGTVPVGNTWLWEPGIVAGPATLTLRLTTGSMTPILRGTAEISSNMIILADTALASTQTKQYNFIMPPAQVELSLAATVADSTFRATIVNARPFG